MPENSFDDRVVIFADGRDWHVRGILAGLERRGVGAAIVPLEKIDFRMGGAARRNGPDPIAIPGFEGRLPRAGFVRTISAGSFEQVTARLGILHGLVAAGVTVWNTPRAIEACVDKSTTTLRIVRAGLPTPETWVTEDPARALALVEAEASEATPLVVKPLFGAQGKGLALVTSPKSLPSTAAVNGVYYLQKLVRPCDGLFRDYRLFVSGGGVVAAMRREAEVWMTNVHQGGKPSAWVPTPEAEAMALAAAAAVGADVAGVDLIEDGDGGFMVLEVNSMPAWSGLQSVTEAVIADRIAGDLARAAGFGTKARLVS